MSTPALDILHRSRPDLRISVVVEDRFRAIFEDNPDVNDILPPSALALRRWGPRLCVNFHGGTRSAWLSALSAPNTVPDSDTTVKNGSTISTFRGRSRF
ncbi:MAG: hypothetical protein WDO73_11565 [Ignavibacteriota bacterium]